MSRQVLCALVGPTETTVLGEAQPTVEMKDALTGVCVLINDSRTERAHQRLSVQTVAGKDGPQTRHERGPGKLVQWTSYLIYASCSWVSKQQYSRHKDEQLQTSQGMGVPELYG